MISDHVVFTSSGFAIEPGEDRDTNPGIYGRALAAWVADGLASRGIHVEGVIAEDFGRLVIVRSKPFRLWVACASLDASTTRWQMFIALEQSLIGRFLSRADPQPLLAQLRGQFHALVAELPSAQDVVWQAC